VVYWITFLLILFNVSAFGDDKQGLPPQFGADINRKLNAVLSLDPVVDCPNVPQGPVSTGSGLIHYVCQNVEQGKQDVDVVMKNLLQLGGDKTLQKDMNTDFNQFADSFRYFWKMNSRIPELYGKKPKNSWDEQFTEEVNATRSKCNYRVGSKGKDQVIQEVRFGDVHFLGIQHFYSFRSNQKIHTANQLLDDRLEKIQASGAKGQQPPYTYILLEGHNVKYGQPLSCETVLYSVFHGEREGDHNEQINLLRYGFMTKTPLVPADNQYLSDSDLDAFYGGDSKKFESVKKDFDFVDILHNYDASLNEALQKHQRISPEEALAQAIERTHSQFYNAEAFKARYLDENKSELPGKELPKTKTNDSQYFNQLQHLLQKVEFSFTPSASLPPWVKAQATNHLVDEQDILRNRALLRAIQISQENFGKATAVFGSGHLEETGSILEREIGGFKNVDFKDDCP
jgi:hypothetical protein